MDLLFSVSLQIYMHNFNDTKWQIMHINRITIHYIGSRYYNETKDDHHHPSIFLLLSILNYNKYVLRVQRFVFNADLHISILSVNVNWFGCFEKNYLPNISDLEAAKMKFVVIEFARRNYTIVFDFCNIDLWTIERIWILSIFSSFSICFFLMNDINGFES